VRQRRLPSALKQLEALTEEKDLWGEVDDNRGWDPALWGAYLKHPDFLSAMITRYGVKCDGASPAYTKDGPKEVSPGCTPLHIAAARGTEACVRLLVAQKARVDATDANGWTPLHSAVCFGQVGVARLLLDMGASVNSSTERASAMHAIPAQSCALHIAVQLEDRKATKLLIRRGARTGQRDAKGTTCQEAAREASRGFWDFFDTEEEIDGMRFSLLMATNARVGRNSSVRHLMMDRVFDPQIFRQIFEFIPSRVEIYNRGF
jgi:hypothetical protein